MEGPAPEPPRLARRILRLVVRTGDRELIDGELRELWAERVADDGERRARRWYRRQVAGFVLRAWSVRREHAHRDRGGGGMRGWESWIGDLRWALRALRKHPTFSAVAVATLALGIGANSAVFTLVKAHFLTPLPYERPDEVVLLWETGRNSDEVTTVAPGNYFTWRDEAHSFEDVASFNVDWATLSGDGPAERIQAANVAPHFFELLGVTPALGGGFDPASVEATEGRLILLSDGLWRRRFGGDPGIVGRDVRVDGLPHRVVGVLPAAYRQPERELAWQRTEVWFPQLLEDRRGDFGSRYLRTIARLAPGVSVERARAEMDEMAVRMAEAQPEGNAGRRIQVWTLDDYLMGDARPVLFMLLGAGTAVLLVICANVANLALARGEERKREFAVRAALGSGRARLLRQVLVESVVLALAGAAAGAGLVFLGRDLLQLVQERFFSGLVPAEVDPLVLAGTTGVAVLAGLLVGLPLALSASSTDLRGTLAQGGRRAGRARRATRNLLIVGQVGLATTLVVSALLLTRSFVARTAVSPGFDPTGVMTFSVSAPSSDYETRADVEGYMREVQREMAALPGVRAVGLVSDLPFTTENRWSSVAVEGRESDPEDPLTSEYRTVLPEYFDVMGIPLVRGTLPADGWVPEAGAVVNETFARRVWGDEDPLGRRVGLTSMDPVSFPVVAVVGDVLDDGFEAEAEPILYLPYGGLPQRQAYFALSTVGATPELATAIRGAMAGLDPDIPAAELRMLDRLMADTVVRPRAASLIGALFAVVALLVAAAGIYGVLSYTVQSRTREIGIRSALGASGDQLLGLVMGHSMRLLAFGLVMGIAGALLVGRLLSGLLFGVGSSDPTSFALAALVLAGVGVLAAWIPARRAVAVDPREALRAE